MPTEPGTVLDAGSSAVNKIDKNPCPHETYIRCGTDGQAKEKKHTRWLVSGKWKE